MVRFGGLPFFSLNLKLLDMYDHQFNKHIFVGYENSKRLSKLNYNKKVIAYYSESYFVKRITEIEKAIGYVETLYKEREAKRVQSQDQTRVIKNAEEHLINLKVKYDIDKDNNNFLLFSQPNCLPKNLNDLDSITPAPLKHEALFWLTREYNIPRAKYDNLFKKVTSESEYIDKMEKAIEVCLSIVENTKKGL